VTQLIVPNQADSETRRSELEQGLSSDIVTTRYSVQFDVMRGGVRESEQTLDVEGSDVVELEMDDGQRLWLRVDELQSQLGIGQRIPLSISPGQLDPSTHTPPNASNNRGAGEWVIKGLKILGVDIAGDISDFISDKVEGRLTPEAGLYACNADSVSSLKPVGKINKSKPILVFLHGTASSTQSSFGALWDSSSGCINDLIRHYGRQTLAFQHKTLTQSPIENALHLLQALLELESDVVGEHPLILHLVSHSRGGLIGEVLSRGARSQIDAFDATDLSMFGRDDYQRDRAALKKLTTLLSKHDVRIERFMRVACPARGTTLADGRFDRYLSGMVNVLEKIPGVANPVFDGLTSLLLAVVHKRTEPQELPGLEAMMPGSPTVRMLNRADVEVNADLHVIGGDVAGDGLFSRFKVLLTDLFYRDDHDLVVNTPAMFGGVNRRSPVRYWIDTGAHVNHFAYFENSNTASRVCAGLLQREGVVFRTLNETPSALSATTYRKRSLEPQPIVFVLPGIMGSHLAIDGERIWLDFAQIAFGGMSRLGVKSSGDRVEPQEPIAESYGELIQFLAQTHDVRPFAYDWRESLRISAERLLLLMSAAQLEAASTDQPLRIIAHSMGGLVVRAMLAMPEGQTLWKRMRAHPGSRFIMLGTPNGGSHAMASMLIGRDALVKKLAMLDLKNDYAQLMKTVVGFDGVLQLLPHNGSIDLYQQASWQKLFHHDVPDNERGLFDSQVAGSKSAGIGWSIPAAAKLKEAVLMRDRLLTSPIDKQRMLYVAGVAAQTPSDITINTQAKRGHQVEVHAVAEGDGRVTWQSGIPADMPSSNVYYMDAIHGDMAADVDNFPALLELLEKGTTEQLGKCKVRIVHGDLAWSQYPVAVGHYHGDTIVSAENYLDKQLDGRLRERHRLGIYPGKIGTSTVLLNWPKAHERKRQINTIHPGAIVIGLGTVGDLTPGTLTSTLVDGLTQYALEVRATAIKRARRLNLEAPKMLEAPLTTLLISASNDLSVSDSLHSILRAVSIVNLRLQAHSDDGLLSDAPSLGNSSNGTTNETPDTHSLPSVKISAVEIIECWEDRAIQAAKAMENLSTAKELAAAFDFHRTVVEGKNGRVRVSFDDQGDWWQRLRISKLPAGGLKFESLTDRARVESNLQSMQRNLVDRYLARATASANYDPALGKTLFELLMPNQLKQYAPDKRHLILMLDKHAAAYPWELMHDGEDSSGRPMAVEAGVVRQLISDEFREQPLMTQALSALVVGDPDTGIDDKEYFSALPGAAMEARQVAAQLSASAYDTQLLVGEEAGPLDVVSALYDHPYRIMHIAGHGVFELAVDDKGRPLSAKAQRQVANPKLITGVVLGDGIYLTPVEFKQMRHVPEFVFINCCHLGNQADGSSVELSRQDRVEYHRLAANVATQLILMGVRAVIAAGWAVNDDAAKLFASTFYDRFLSNQSFGESVVAARAVTYEYERGRGGCTWGAYQCYGDPDFSLQPGDINRPQARPEMPVSVSEFRQWLDNLAQRASYADQQQHLNWQAELEQMIKVVTPDWFEYGSICAAVASAYAELGNLEQAAHYYQLASCCEHADARISSLEQLANMKARIAVSKGADARFELEEAAKLIESLLQIHGTQERFSLKGGVHKRLARLAETSEDAKTNQVERLKSMASAYNSAYQIAIDQEQFNIFYPLQNRLAARIALSWCVGLSNPPTRRELNAQIRDDLDQLQQLQQNGDPREVDFWILCQSADRQFLDALSNKIVSQKERTEIAQAYEAARERGGSARQMKSICDHMEFFLSVARLQLREGPQKIRLCESLESLIERISQF